MLCVSVLHGVAVYVAECCSVLLCVIVCCSMLQCVAVCGPFESVVVCEHTRSESSHTALTRMTQDDTCVRDNTQCVAVCCSVLQCVAVCCSVLPGVAVCCSVLAEAGAGRCGSKRQGGVGERLFVLRNTNGIQLYSVIVRGVSARILRACCSVLQRVAVCCSVLWLYTVCIA